MKTLLFTMLLAAAPLVAHAQVQILGAPPTGQALGTLSGNPYVPSAPSNPYGRFGNPYSPDSFSNPYGRYGNPYSPDSVTNPYGTGGARVYGNE